MIAKKDVVARLESLSVRTQQNTIWTSIWDIKSDEAEELCESDVEEQVDFLLSNGHTLQNLWDMANDLHEAEEGYGLLPEDYDPWAGPRTQN